MILLRNYGMLVRVYDVKRKAGEVVAKTTQRLLTLPLLRMRKRIERHRNN
jgi:hypothetical protein